MTGTQRNAALLEILTAGLAELSHPRAHESAACEQLAELALLVSSWAVRLNLTGPRSAEEIARELVLDAIALEQVLPPAASIADVGSGAGFPGLPIALFRPDTRVTLIESRERRHHFLRHAIRTLAIPNAIALRGRAESLPPSPHALALAQAAARPRQALRWLVPWVAPGATAAIPGGSTPPAIDPVPGLHSAQVVSYRVPLSGKTRTLWLGVIERPSDAGCA